MADLFGAPLGDIAYNKNVLTQMQALSRAGDASLIPARRDLLEAEIANQQSLLETREAKLDSAAALSELGARYHKLNSLPAKEKENLTDALRVVTGETPTQEMAAEVLNQSSAADRLDHQGDFFYKNGQTDRAITLWENAAKLRKDNNSAMQEKSLAEKEQSQTQRLRLQEIANQAAAVGRDEAAWNRYVMSQRSSGKPPLLPEQLLSLPYAQAKPHLEDLRIRGLGAIAENKRREDKRSTDARIAANQATEDAARARAKVAKVNLELAERDLVIKKKYDGDNAKAALDAKNATIEAARIKAEMDTAISQPPFPVDPKDATVGYTYTINEEAYIFRGIHDVTGDPEFIKAPEVEE